MTCPKCRSERIASRYSESHMAFRCVFGSLDPCYAGEHMHHRCKGCGYAWQQAL